MKKSILINEPGNELPNQFTICASVFITYFKTPLGPFMLLKEDGSLWFNFVFVIGGKDSKHYQMYLYYDKKSYSNGVLIPLLPHSWSHTCVSVNVKTKRIRVVFNELVVFDDTIEDVKTGDKPRTLENRLILNFVNQNGKIYPTLHSTGNVNIHRKALSIKEMESITSGFECESVGDYLAWKEMSFRTVGNISVEFTDKMCRKHDGFLKAFTAEFNSWSECMRFCPKVEQSRVPETDTQEKLASMIMWYKKTLYTVKSNFTKPNDDILENFYSPYSDLEVEGVYKDFYTSERISFDIFYPGQPNGKRVENCASVYISKNGLFDNVCDSMLTFARHCVCRSKSVPLLKLRGLCPNSDIDTLFTVINDEENGQLNFLGVTSTRITYDEKKFAWKSSATDVTVTAFSEAPKKSFLLGKNTWTIFNDSIKCNKGLPVTLELKMTGCKEDEFTCADGQCIRMDKRCNQVSNCKDLSDEVECETLVIGESYSNQVPPLVIDENEEIIPAIVIVSTSVLDIIKIAEDDNKIVIKFRIILQWKDGRVSYQNIKKKVYLNALKQYEIEKLWTPYVIYKNTENNDATTTQDIFTSVTVTREGNFTRSPPSSIDEVEIFQGDENTLTMNQSYTKEFRCQYKFHFFPFDTQVN